MSHPSSLKKEVETERPSKEAPRFDRNRLAHELLSLGNPKITSTIARLIAQEVEDELQEAQLPGDLPLQRQRRVEGDGVTRAPAINPEVISDMVRKKLEELGLIEIKSIKPRPKKSDTEKAMKTIHPFTPREKAVKGPAKPPRPALENLRWSEEGSQFFSSLSLPLENEPKGLEKFLQGFCRTIASVDCRYHPEADVETASIHFYNRLAALDFVPGRSVFMTDLKSGEVFGAPCGLNLPLSASNLYRSLESLEKQLKDPSQAFSKLTLAFTPTREKASEEDLKVIELFLKLLKTRLEHHAQATGNCIKQELYLPFPAKSGMPAEESSSLFSFLVDWVHQPANRPYFALSYGVRRTRWEPSLPGKEAHSWEFASARALEPLENRFQGPGSIPTDLSGLARQFHRELMAHPNLRLFFLDDAAPAGEVPSPSSAVLHESEAWIPSGSVNLSALVLEEDIDWDRLRRAVRHGVHFLDNVIDLWRYPSEAAERSAHAHRKISLGVMGFSDLLYQLRIPYDGEEALELASKLAFFIQEEAVKASQELAKSRGTFPNYIGSAWQKRGVPVRNAQLTALSWDPLPSNIAQVAPGIEPHAVLVAQELSGSDRPRYLLHPFLAGVAAQRGLSNERILHKIIEAGSLQRVEEIPEDIRNVFVTANDVNWERQLSVAQAFERHWDGGVAKLCTLRAPWEEKELEAVLRRAIALKLSSLWLKRIGEPFDLAMEKQEAAALPLETPAEPVLETVEEEMEEEVTEVKALLPEPPKPPLRERPERLQGSTHPVQTTCGRLFITINQDEKGPFELFTSLGRSTGCSAVQIQALARFITLSLRAGAPLDEILAELRDSPCAGYRAPRDLTPSCTEALAEALAAHRPKEEEILVDSEPEKIAPTAECSDCGKPFLKLNGSAACPPCRGETETAH